MKYEKYFNMKNSEIPPEISKKLISSGANTITAFDDKNIILTDSSLQAQAGYSEMENGDYLVSMYTPMPNVTVDMLNWWFWWHPQEKERYQLWFPGEHFGISYSKENNTYFSQSKVPTFQNNIQYPIERIGKIKMPLSISFVSPEEFGFDSKTMKENNVATIICGHVGAFRGMVEHTEMAHICFQQENGLFMVSRFWIGKRLSNNLIRKFILTEETAKGMAEHCCVEYRNLAKKLPELYKEFA
ncbi:MAG: DAPG hydrolase family protein [Eubacterium sp.]